MKEIKNRVIKQDFINWREMEWIQGDLKDITHKQLDKLIHSIMTEDIIKAFHVWENDNKLYCLDGNHLRKALEEIENRKLASIPDKLKADFIKCDNMKQAARAVLKYSAIYTQIASEGLFDFIGNYDLNNEWDDILKGLETPGFDLKRFTSGWLKDIDFDNDFLNEGDEEVSNQDDLQFTNTCPKCGFQW